MKEATLKHRMVTGFVWVASTKLVAQVLSWVSTIIVARILNPDDYGLVAISGIFIGILVVVTEMGLSQGLINKAEVSKRDMDSIFWLSLLLGATVFCLLYIVAPYIGSWYESETLVEIIRVSALVPVFSSLKAVPIAIAMREMNFKYRSIVEMVGQLVSIVTVVTMAINGYGVWSLVWAVVAMHIVTFLAYLPILKSIPLPRIYIKETLSVVSFGVKLMLSRMFEFLSMKSSVLIISMFLGERTTGYYSMAAQLANMPMDKIGSIFNNVIFPALSRIKDDDDSAKDIFLRTHKYLLIISYPIFVTLILTAEDIVQVLLTDKWASIVPLLQAFSVVNLLRVSGMVMPYTLAGVGKASMVLKYEFLSFFVLSVSFLVGAQYGLSGIIYAWLVGYPIIYIYLLKITLNEMKIGFYRYVKSIVSILVTTSIVFVAVASVLSAIPGQEHVLRLAVALGLIPVLYIVIFVLFYSEDLYEVRKIYYLIRGKRRISI